MRIAMFTDTYKPTINGVVTAIEIIKKELERKGHTVFIFAPMLPGETKRQKRVFRFNSMVFPFQPEHRLTFPYSRILNKFERLRFDVIHAQTPFSMGILAAYLAKKYHIPLVHTYHTLFTEYIHYMKLEADVFKDMVKWASKRYCNMCDVIVAPSAKIVDELIDYGVKPPIEVIPTGIDFIEEADLTPTQDLIKKFNIPSGRKLLCYAGRLGKEKNIDFIINLFPLVLKKFPNTHLLVVGDGPEKKHLVELSQKLNISDHITFTGYVDRIDVFSIANLSDIFTFASTTETQGLVVIEALSMKTPVVAVDAMGVSDVLIGNVGGFLTRLDSREFSEKIMTLLGDDSIYQTKAQEAIIRAHEWSAENMTAKLIKCYNNIIRK